MKSFIDNIPRDFKIKVATLIKDEMLMDKNNSAEFVYSVYNEALVDDFLFIQMTNYMKHNDKQTRSAIQALMERYLEHVACDRYESNA